MPNFFIIIFLIFTFYQALFCQSISSRLITVDSLCSAGEYKKGLIIIDQIINEESNKPTHYYKRALLQEKLKSYLNAEKDFSKAINLSPGNDSLLYGRAMFYTKREKYYKALLDLNRCIKIDSLKSHYFLNRGTVFSRLGKQESSFQDYCKTIELDSSQYMAYLNRSLHYLLVEQMDSLCFDTKKAIKYLPKDSSESNIEIREQLNSQSEEFCNRENLSYYYHRGIAAYNTFKYLDAIEFYNSGLKEFKNNPLLLSFKGNAYLEQKEYDKAIKNYIMSNKYKQNLLSTVVSNPGLNATTITPYAYADGIVASNYTGIAISYLHKKNFSEAKSFIKEAIKKSKQSRVFEEYIRSSIIEGEIFLSQNELKKARYIFTQVFREDKNNAQIWESSARLKIAEVLVPDVIEFDYFDAIINPYKEINILSGKSIFNRIHQVNFDKNDLNNALQDCNEAISRNEKLARAYFTRAVIKLILKEDNYCKDIKNAEKYGIKNAVVLLGVACNP